MKYCDNQDYKEGRIDGCISNSRRPPKQSSILSPFGRASLAEYTRGFNEGRLALAAQRDRDSKAKKRAKARAKR